MSIPLSTAVSLSITIADRAISQQGFGTPLILGSAQAIAPDRVKTYSASSWSASMLADGYVVADAEYKAASALMSQSPRVNQFKVARRAAANVPTQNFTATPTGVAEGAVYAVTINDVVFTVTAGSGDTATDVSTDLHTLINAGAEPVTSTDNTGSIDLDEDVAGAQNEIRFTGDFTVVDGTTDGASATELAAIQALDPDWYGLILTSQAPAEIIAAAAWTEANKKRFNALAQNSDIRGSGSSDVGSTLQTSAYNYTKLTHNKQPGDYHDAAIMSREFSYLPGTYTLTYQGVSGAAASSFTATELSNLAGKNVGVVETFGGQVIYYDGKAASGRYADTTRFLDWLQARIEEATASLFVNARGKVPFTDLGIEQVKNAIMGVLQLAVSRGALLGEGSGAPVVEAPLASAVSTANKALRTLPDITFNCTYTGAVEAVTITGNVSL